MRLPLFSYHNEVGRVSLSIERSLSFEPTTVRKYGPKTPLSSNIVRFTFLELECDNSFTALSSIESLLTIFIRSQFGQNRRRAYAKVDGNINAIAEKISFQDGRMPLLRLELEGGVMWLKLDMPLVHQFNHALRKAMNWVSPEPHFERKMRSKS